MRTICRTKLFAVPAVALAMTMLSVVPSFGQNYPPQGYPQGQAQGYPQGQPQGYPQAGPALPPPAQLDQLVSRIALYPDPLLAQVLAASTFGDQIPAAAAWADQHHYLNGPALAGAINNDHLNFDPGVQALLPFPSVLEMMNADMYWTSQIGNAFLVSQQAVMDSVQRMRQSSMRYGYLRTNPQVIVGGGPYITIMPANPEFITVPYYDPGVVFFPPRPGFVIGGAINFGYGVTIGGFLRPWGWGLNRWDWGAHRLYVNDGIWGRTWVNRSTYVHPYGGVTRYNAAPPPERHEMIYRSPQERDVPHSYGGGRGREEHEGRDRR